MRKRLVLWIIIFLFSIFTQSFWKNLFPWLEGSFFVLIFLIFFALFSQVEKRCLQRIFFGAGFIVDLAFFYPLGFHALSFMASFLFFLFLSRRLVSLENERKFLLGFFLVMTTLIFGYFFENSMIRALALWQGSYYPKIEVGGFLGSIVFASGIYIIFYSTFKKISEKLSFKEMALVIKR